MRKLIVTIEFENNAFANGRADAVASRILRELAERISHWTLPAEVPAQGYDLGPLFDYNGNPVGKAEII